MRAPGAPWEPCWVGKGCFQPPGQLCHSGSERAVYALAQGASSVCLEVSLLWPPSQGYWQGPCSTGHQLCSLAASGRWA